MSTVDLCVSRLFRKPAPIQGNSCHDLWFVRSTGSHSSNETMLCPGMSHTLWLQLSVERWCPHTRACPSQTRSCLSPARQVSPSNTSSTTKSSFSEDKSQRVPRHTHTMQCSLNTLAMWSTGSASCTKQPCSTFLALKELEQIGLRMEIEIDNELSDSAVDPCVLSLNFVPSEPSRKGKHLCGRRSRAGQMRMSQWTTQKDRSASQEPKECRQTFQSMVCCL